MDDSEAFLAMSLKGPPQQQQRAPAPPSAPNSGGGSVNPQQQQPNEDGQPIKVQYSIPGILHFIQHEWARFELERSQWEVDRAELQVIAIINS